VCAGLYFYLYWQGAMMVGVVDNYPEPTPAWVFVDSFCSWAFQLFAIVGIVFFTYYGVAWRRHRRQDAETGADEPQSVER